MSYQKEWLLLEANDEADEMEQYGNSTRERSYRR